MNKVYLLLGSNLGNRVDSIKSAKSLIQDRIGKISHQSHNYESAPWGKLDQPAFINCVLLVETNLIPTTLLEKILAIENDLGRKRIEKWGERIIDIDILYFNTEIWVTHALKIPHPSIQDRNFTLIPLAEIAPHFKHPIFNISNQQMLMRCTDDGKVTILPTH